MCEGKSDSNTTRKEAGKFRALLRGILRGRRPVDELLEYPLFKRRLTALCRLLMGNEWDAQELYNDVCVKVYKALRLFKPDFKQPYGKFFAWLRTITRNSFFDKKRGIKPEFTADGLDGLDLVDPGIDVEDHLEWNERKRRLREAIARLPPKKRVAVVLYIQYGYSSRETAKILTDTGIKCTHASVAKWVRDTLKSTFPEAPMIQALLTPPPPRKPNAPAGRRSAGKKVSQENKRAGSLDKVEVIKRSAKR